MKEFLMLIREDLSNYGKLTPEEMQADIEKHMQWVGSLVEKGHFKSGDPLMPIGKHIKGKDQLPTDGPYIETKEGVSGFYFLLAGSLDQAIEIAKGCPSLEHGSVEVREVIKTDHP